MNSFDSRLEEKLKNYPDFSNGQYVTCIDQTRGTGTRPDVNLTKGKLYSVISCEIDESHVYVRRVSVENDLGEVVEYSSKRFKIDRGAIISNLLKES